MARFSSFDFETYYNSKTKYSLRSMPTRAYVYDPQFHAYMVSIVTDDGYNYVGPVEEADWSKIENTIVCIHNASFDELIMERLRELGLVPRSLKYSICDTADLAAYNRCKRDLESACLYLLNTRISKVVRARMDGRVYASLTAKEHEALLKYAADDAKYSMVLGMKYYDKWPEHEREFSRLNREAGWRGIIMDPDDVKSGIHLLHSVRDAAESRLPWVLDGEAANSAAAFRKQAAIEGIPVPASLDKKDPLFITWSKENAPKYAWVKAREDMASVNGHLNRLITMRDFSHENVFPIQIKYCGAIVTARCSGGTDESEEGGKFNPQNLARNPLIVNRETGEFAKDPRKEKTDKLPAPLAEINIRGCLRPRKGNAFFIADYAQIEARMVQWLAGNKKFLQILKKEGNLYQAYAKMVGWYDGSDLKHDDPDMYRLAKACLAEGTLVLVRSGLTTPSYKRIEDVRLEDEVWNGTAWVRHHGVVCNGLRDTVVFAGVDCTPDHRWFDGREWNHAVSKGSEAPAFSWAESTRPEGAGLWALACGIGRSLSREVIATGRVCLSRLWRNGTDRLVQLKARAVDALQRLRQEAVGDNTGSPGMGQSGGRVRPTPVRTVAADGVAVHESSRSQLG